MKRLCGKLKNGLFVLFFFLCGCATLYNPATGQKEYIFISTESEVKMGQDIQKQLSAEFTFIESGRQFDRIQRIGRRLAAVSDRRDLPYHFYLIDKDELNAFTVPGGSIYIFSGLLNKLDGNDNAVAAVLAHEIGHCAARHTVKKFQAALGYSLVGSILLSQIDQAAVKDVAAMSTNAVMQIVFSAYGRQDEYQADQLGVKYLDLAGFNVVGMVQTLDVLKKASGGSSTPAILLTHPHPEDRIAAVKKQIESMQK